MKHMVWRRSCRVISTARFALAVSCLARLWWDVGQPAFLPALGHMVVVSYCLCAGALVAATWNNWWREYAMAPWVVALDMIFYGALIFVENASAAPSFAVFIFIMLAALQQNRFRMMEWAAALCILEFGLIRYAALTRFGTEADLEALPVQIAYRIILALLFIWFAGNRDRTPGAVDPSVAMVPEARSPLEMLLDDVITLTGSRDLVMLSVEIGTPEVTAWTRRRGGFARLEAFTNDALAMRSPLIGTVALVEAKRDRAIVYDPASGHAGRLQLQEARTCLTALGINKALTLSVACKSTTALIFVRDMNGLCSGDLPRVWRIAQHLSAQLDQRHAEHMAATRAKQEIRLALARDIHDSVAQVLAGTAMRLQALTRQFALAGPLRVEVQALTDDLQQERRDVRRLITKLRDGLDEAEVRDSTSHKDERLAQLCQRLSQQWSVPCDLRVEGEERLSPAIAHDVRQIIREATSNAVRHGRATQVRIRLFADSHQIEMKIESDGFALPSNDVRQSTVQPWTVHTRVRDRGGFVHFTSDAGRSVIDINLPLEDAA